MERKAFMQRFSVGLFGVGLSPLLLGATTKIKKDKEEKNPLYLWKKRGGLWPDYMEMDEYGITNRTSDVPSSFDSEDYYNYHLMTFVPIVGVKGGGVIMRRSIRIYMSLNSEYGKQVKADERREFFVDIDNMKKKHGTKNS